MKELAESIVRIQHGETEEYAVIVARFQDMAVGYAYAALGDLALAEDVAQEAFIAAYYTITALREPAAFPGWFRRIVHTQIKRAQRRQTSVLVPLAAAEELTTLDAEPHTLFEQQLLQEEVAQAIALLPLAQCQVLTLFYMGEYSQQEISHFLNIPVSTVKMRLYHARQRLKERMLRMIKDTLYRQRPSRDQTFAQDVQAMLALLQGRTVERSADYPGVVDLQELMGMAETQAYTRLWEDQTGRLIGFAIIDPAYCTLTFVIDQQAAPSPIDIEMLAWGEQQLQKAGCSVIRTNCRTENQERSGLLMQQGFVAETVSNLQLRRSLVEAIPTPQLPFGFTIQHVSGEHEVDRLVELQRAAFGTENMTTAFRLAMMRVPDYDPMLDLIVVAPDGQWVAFCLAWFSQADNQRASQPIGWLDPVGTLPDFQHRGLAKALLLTGLALLKERGMKLASTNAASNNVAMQRAAASVGFRVKEQTQWYQKNIG
ncbi:MAG: sigma-70 family RNA polymerase sigma factor [Caldilineaceae bacterium]|nr:sigma-70 family RNA polymerase sigma factor [Caldilineaceae bacterium]